MTGHVRRRSRASWELKFDLGTDPVTGKRLPAGRSQHSAKSGKPPATRYPLRPAGVLRALTTDLFLMLGVWARLRMESDQEESVKGLLGPLVERILYTFKDEKNA